jgi:hypothetical protein
MIVTFVLGNNSCTKEMKRVLLVLALISAVACSSAFAQLTIGGKVGFGYNGGSETAKVAGVTTEKDGNSDMTFTFLPYAIYSLRSDLGVGTHLGITYSSLTVPANSTEKGHGNDKTTTSDFIFHFTPFVRYHLLGNDRISLFIDGQIPLQFGSKGATKTVNGDKTTTADGASLLGIGVGMVPGIQVNLTSRFALIATANVASVNFNYERLTTEVGGATTTTTGTGFSLGVNGAVPSKTPFMVGLALSF